MPKGGHIDATAANKGGWVGGCMIVACTYLHDVGPRGGGTCYFPGSHRAVHKYMAAHPEEYIDATFKNGWGFDASYGENNLAEYMEGGGVRPPVESVMRAGSVCFSHGLMVHSRTSNVNAEAVRVGIFSRWHQADMPTYRDDMPRPMWKYWEGQALRDVLSADTAAAAKL
jgi:hypothetical protein